MNVYDTANRLSQELKQSEEYVNYKMAKQVINMKPDIKQKIKDFSKEKYDLQVETIQTGKNDEEKLKKIQKDYEDIVEYDEGKKYFEAEAKFNLLLGDVNKIIGEGIKDVLSQI